MKKTLLTLATLATLNAQAEVQLGAHVHGEAQLDTVLEGEHLNINLTTPAMNVMSFEHEPNTDADLDTSHKALHTLADAEWIAIKGGECELENVKIDWEHAEKVHDHFHGEHKHDEHKHDEHKHDEHKHDEHKHDEHKHDEHKHDEHKHDEHKHDEHKHDEHKHDEHEHGEHEHSDIVAKYAFHCHKPQSIKSIDVDIFSAFNGFEKVNVQWIREDKQGSHVLNKKAHSISLK